MEHRSLAGRSIAVIVGGLVHVVVIRDDARHHNHRNQQRAIENHPAQPHAADQLRRDRGDQPSSRQRQAEFPGPKHQVQIVLPAHLAPEREAHVDGDQKYDDKQRTNQLRAHVVASFPANKTTPVCVEQ